MGTWGTGPFDSDLAADFVDELEGLTHQQVIDVLGRAFQRVTDSGERVDGGDGAEAVAAGALVASTLPDSSIVIDPDDGSSKPLPGPMQRPATAGTVAGTGRLQQRTAPLHPRNAHAGCPLAQLSWRCRVPVLVADPDRRPRIAYDCAGFGVARTTASARDAALQHVAAQHQDVAEPYATRVQRARRFYAY
ncbi:DUF4259 domain-containing protein [Streptomyces sp. NPDC046978]|uniref:DUF4259 domain-containing protein n=1 Tax=Streptomyces sp. NPDC046978 TaxID=3154704 RepID=UPI0033E51D5C